MGVPVHAFKYRTDNKLYKLQTPQSPLVKPVAYDVYDMDRYPLGTNAIVAVISYTVNTVTVALLYFLPLNGQGKNCLGIRYGRFYGN